jgi:hypothetical protein
MNIESLSTTDSRSTPLLLRKGSVAGNRHLRTLGAASAAAALMFGLSGRAAEAAVINPAYEYSSAGTLSDDRQFTLGFEFSLSTPETVNALGYTIVGFASDQQVGIWNSAGALLTSATVSTGDSVVGHFAWTSIAPLTLGPGTYTIGGTYDGGLLPSLASGVTSIPGYTWIEDEQANGPGLIDPTFSAGGYGDNGIPQVDFSVSTTAIPEPATWITLILGLAISGIVVRRRKGSAEFA